MTTPTNILADLQDQFKALHANYGKIPRMDFERRSVELLALMDIVDTYIKIENNGRIIK